MAHPQPRKQGARANAPTAGELPVTRAMLGEVRTELLERIEQLKNELKADIYGVRADIESTRADIHSVRADVARIALLVEEQNARNKVVLDGIVAMMARQDRLEHRMDNVEETVRAIAAAPPPG